MSSLIIETIKKRSHFLVTNKKAIKVNSFTTNWKSSFSAYWKFQLIYRNSRQQSYNLDLKNFIELSFKRKGKKPKNCGINNIKEKTQQKKRNKLLVSERERILQEPKKKDPVT